MFKNYDFVSCLLAPCVKNCYYE